MNSIVKTIQHNVPHEYENLARRMYYRLRTIVFKGNEFWCPCCQHTFRRFLPYSNRSHALCPGCGSLERHRLYWLYLQKNTSFFEQNQTVLHFAPAYILQDKFSKLDNLNYITTDLLIPGVDIHMDITDILFRDEVFDVVFCSHILEHVPDDIGAMREIYRVLKPTGWALFQTPIDYDLESTFEDPDAVTPEQRERLFGQDDHVRQYGRDFRERLVEAGFQVEIYQFKDHFSNSEISQYGLTSTEKITEEIFICRKKD